MTATTTTPMHIHRLELTNFRKLRHQIVDAKGRHIRISGKNGTGKSAFIRALQEATRGRSANRVKEPIRTGEEEAQILVDFAEYVVKRTYKTGKPSELEVKDPRGKKIEPPQQRLNDDFSSICCDLGEFLGEHV